MEQHHRDILRNNWVYLMDNVTLDYLLPVLFQKRILSDDLIEQIEAERTPKQKNYSFLTILQRRGSKAFDAFIEALDESDQDHVCERLLMSNSTTARTSRGNVLGQPEDFSNAPSTSTLEDDFYSRLSLKNRGDEKEQKLANGNRQNQTTQNESTSQSESPPPPPPPSGSSDPSSPHRRGSVEHSIRQFTSTFDISVKKMDALPLDFSVRLGSGEMYPNFKQPKGLCLIINNREFQRTSNDLAYRKGSDRDAANLTWLFEQIGYDVCVHRDLDSEAFEEALERFASDDRHSRADSAVVCVLSHGQEKGVYATDGIVINFSFILDALDGQQCPLLVNKPKLFFFQACRGVRVQRGFDVVDEAGGGGGGAASPMSSSNPPSGTHTPVEEVSGDLSSSSSSSSIAKPDDFYRIDSSGDVTVPRGGDKDDVDAIFKATSLAKYSDMLVSYSTIPGHISIRHEEMGSWYVQAIVDVFSEFAVDRDIHSLLTKVNRKVSKMTTGGHIRKQMPEPRNHLTRDFYFFPGYVQEDQNRAIQSLFDIGSCQPLEMA